MAKKSIAVAKERKGPLRRLGPWLLLAFGLALFYDLNPAYPLLLKFGLNAHLPIPNVVDESWSVSSRPNIQSVESAPGSNNVFVLHTGRGPVRVKAYPVKDADLGVVVVGGVGGAFDSPAQGLFDKLGKSFMRERIHTLHLCFRHPTDLAETVYDARAAVFHLNQLGVQRVILVGHSLGGAAVISAASFEPSVVGVVPMSSQPYGADRIAVLKARVLVVSGLLDVVEPPAWSKAIFKEATGDREIAYFVGSHNLHECAADVYDRLFHWILDCKIANMTSHRDSPRRVRLRVNNDAGTFDS